jgi:Flp pilus assembly protein TadB
MELLYTSEAPGQMFRLLRRQRELDLYWWTGTLPLLLVGAWLLAGAVIIVMTQASPWRSLGQMALIVAVAAAIWVVWVPRKRNEIASLRALEDACASDDAEPGGPPSAAGK